MNILITGGAGYIGSHTAVLLSQNKHEISIIDNFSNSDISVINQISNIVKNTIDFVEADIRDTKYLTKIIKERRIEAVIHFAGLKSISESILNPDLYHLNNVIGTLSLIQAMQANQVKICVFSSSATVYGTPKYLPYDELHPTNPINPYGESKLKAEHCFEQWAKKDPTLRISILRYFNPIGAHESGLIGENPNQKPNNLMPIILQAASGAVPTLQIYGDNYDTPDGTAVRDYVHVMDIADGHLASLNFLASNVGVYKHNLGSGRGVSVLKLIEEFEKANHVKITKFFGPRRNGDLSIYFSNPKKAQDELKWFPKRGISEACKDAYRFFKYYLN